MEIVKQVQEFIFNNFFYGSRQAQLNNKDSFLKTGVIDSTGILELVMFLENTYSISVEDEELIPENLDSLENVSKFVTYKLTNKN